MKELELEFIGTGEVKGDLFKQVNRSPKAYIYERTIPDVSKYKMYEVFKRKISKESTGTLNGVEVHFEERVIYPSSKAFGVWAKAFTNYDKAMELFNLYSNEEDRSKDSC
jgi:hypothetical protein